MPALNAEWPLSIDREEYHPVPESWVEAASAYDEDPDAPAEAIRLYATSAAIIGGRFVSVRYSAPRFTKVLEYREECIERSDGEGYVPRSLFKGGWSRSRTAKRDDQPSGVRRKPELEHLLELWGDRLEVPTTDVNGHELIADGGRAVRNLFDPRAYSLESPEFSGGEQR